MSWHWPTAYGAFQWLGRNTIIDTLLTNLPNLPSKLMHFVWYQSSGMQYQNKGNPTVCSTDCTGRWRRNNPSSDSITLWLNLGIYLTKVLIYRLCEVDISSVSCVPLFPSCSSGKRGNCWAVLTGSLNTHKHLSCQHGRKSARRQYPPKNTTNPFFILDSPRSLIACIWEFASLTSEATVCITFKAWIF